MTSSTSHVDYERIQRYSREAENSMYKAKRELGKLQSEQQYRREAFPLTVEQSTNPEAFVHRRTRFPPSAPSSKS